MTVNTLTSWLTGNPATGSAGGSPIVLGGSANDATKATDGKTAEVASKAIHPPKDDGVSHPPALPGRADPSPVGRTWTQFGRLVASYATFGFIPAPTVRAPASIDPPVAAQVDTKEEPAAPLPAPSPAPTFIERAMESIKSFFTAIYNMLFGARSS